MSICEMRSMRLYGGIFTDITTGSLSHSGIAYGPPRWRIMLASDAEGGAYCHISHRVCEGIHLAFFRDCETLIAFCLASGSESSLHDEFKGYCTCYYCDALGLKPVKHRHESLAYESSTYMTSLSLHNSRRSCENHGPEKKGCCICQ